MIFKPRSLSFPWMWCLMSLLPLCDWEFKVLGTKRHYPQPHTKTLAGLPDSKDEKSPYCSVAQQQQSISKSPVDSNYVEGSVDAWVQHIDPSQQANSNGPPFPNFAAYRSSLHTQVARLPIQPKMIYLGWPTSQTVRVTVGTPHLPLVKWALMLMTKFEPSSEWRLTKKH